ncbi:hypothetical protein [Actinomadura vinacea]|uniref:hypothetical protein n=1 Tax=Actinomadura vinacea TaxID=115336 RepID=UPI0031D9D673
MSDGDPRIDISISDDHIATLRAFLVLDSGWEELVSQLAQRGSLGGFAELGRAAFVVAVRRRFFSWSVAEIVRFVSAVRVRLLQDDIEIDPSTAESLIRSALGDVSQVDLDPDKIGSAQLLLLGELIFERDLNDAELDDFLNLARRFAAGRIGDDL